MPSMLTASQYRQDEALITGSSAASTVHHNAPQEVDNFSSSAQGELSYNLNFFQLVMTIGT
ncbi:hypothetical protein HYDPIDRAFT_105516 [Hydnomerulius pinastri MD-312]|nr:hypothetical protein HYDPIDRAFT_105516 [Hydnomerulius pinastri MD-312]